MPANGTTPAEPTAQALELRGVTAGYGRTTVLRDVDVAVPAGSIVALLGPNGAGKTTLLRVAAGLLRQTSGSVVVCGEEVTRRHPHARGRAGLCLIPEGRGVFPNLSVRENLLLQVPPWEQDRSVVRALEAFPILRERLGQAAGSLSGGEQQMLALSRCFLAKPTVVLLDEVSMGLAPLIIDQIFEALRRLAGEGVALLLVEQYVDRALEMAEGVYLLNQGSIGFSGSPSELDKDEVMRRYIGADLDHARGPSANGHSADGQVSDRQ
jgi:branched-chain amino acid transport system ATP-binding protein